jgi:hypothetical protein
LACCYPPQPEIGTHPDLELLTDAGESSSAAAAAPEKDVTRKRKQPVESEESGEYAEDSGSSSSSSEEERKKKKRSEGFPAMPLASAPPLLKGMRVADFAVVGS